MLVMIVICPLEDLWCLWAHRSRSLLNARSVNTLVTHFQELIHAPRKNTHMASCILDCSSTRIETQDEAWVSSPQRLTSHRNANSVQPDSAYPPCYPNSTGTPYTSSHLTPETASIRCECLLSHIKISVVLLLEMLHVFLLLVSFQLCQ